ncbi:MAG TPA: hypothetical protein VM695_13610 [Phycisphaerae bacterium]|nr:hypothetical protein [Phycisphaerae bacterium]
MIKLWSIGRNAFLQTIRQPVYTVMVLVTFGLLVFTLPFSGYTMSTDYQKTDQQFLEDLGLATLRVSSLLIAAFSASGVLRREIEEKTALIVISKPVSRAVFVLGRFLGVAAAVAVAYYLCCLVLLMTVRHRVMPAQSDPIDWPVIVLGFSALGLTVLTAMLGNLWFGWQFTSTGVRAAVVLLTAAMIAIGFVGKGWRIVPFGFGIPSQVLLELAMMLLAVVIFVALAVAASARLGQAMTLGVCTAVFVVGSAHPQVFGPWADEVPVVRVLGWVVPNLSHFYPQDDLRIAGAVPLGVVGFALLYGALYTLGLLALAVSLFQTRELEAQAAAAGTPGLVNLLAWAGRAGAVVAALAGLVVLTVPRLYSTASLLAAAGLIVGAAAGWLVWAAFGYGGRWSYWLVLAASAAGAAAGTVLLISPHLGPRPDVATPVLIATATALAAAVLVVLFLPKTRRHFGFAVR